MEQFLKTFALFALLGFVSVSKGDILYPENSQNKISVKKTVNPLPNRNLTFYHLTSKTHPKNDKNSEPIVFRDDENILEEDSKCRRTYDGKMGFCTLAYNCTHVIREFRENGVKIDICSYKKKIPIICCPPYNRALAVADEDQQRPSIKKCRKYYNINSSKFKDDVTQCQPSVPLIVGGEPTYPGEYPHMAAVGWSRRDHKISWACGGTLINEKFVLTAAHCTILGGKPPNVVRLGAQNLKNAERKQDIMISKIIPYPKYRAASYYHDIALLKLERTVQFTKYIKPACLWYKPELKAKHATAIGWGRLEFLGLKSEELQKVELEIIENEQCQKFYRKERKLPKGIIKKQFCAGYAEGGKDTCQGDSGGPVHVTLAKYNCVSFVIGITSFGRYCAAPNSFGVYTRISSYIDWIDEVAFKEI